MLCVTDLQPGLWDDESALDGDVLPETDEDVYQPTATPLDTVEIRRSARRKRSVVAFREGERTIVVAPQRMSQKDLDEYVRELVGRLDIRDQRGASHDALWRRTVRIVAEYFDHDVLAAHPVPVTVRWVTNQNGRWGSCTPGDGAIRLSHRLTRMPDYVIDCVLMHELIHLMVTDHGPRFTEIMARYPHLERASAYLEGYSLAEQGPR